MNNSQFESSSDTTDLASKSGLQMFIRVFAESWLRYSAVLLGGAVLILAVAMVTGSASGMAGVAMTLLLAGTGIHIVVSNRVAESRIEVLRLGKILSNEASASRILDGIHVLNSTDSTSPDARLATAARMATDYPAAVVFNLRAGLGVLAPSNWSYDGQLSQIREEFESSDSELPGASAARQGSAIVMSSSNSNYMPLPGWAENAGFSQGIVAPISRGLDTVGVVYALNKSQALPTLAQIEQLELIVSFVSSTASVQDFSSSASQNQPFRVIDSSPQERRTQVAPPIRMEGFTLNPEFERMEMGGTLVSLSPTEFLLMHTLASSPDQPISPDELMDRCWTKDSRPADNAVDVAIFRLRKKLNKIDSGKGLIKTVRGNGYMFVPPSVEPSAAIVAD